MSKRILVVSGEAERADHLVGLLATGGDDVEAVRDGAEAFQRIWDVEYDVIVSEIGMPGIDGRDFCMALQNTWPELIRRLVFVSPWPNGDAEAFAGRSAVPLVRGPVNLFTLHEAVRTVHATRAPLVA